MMWPIDPDDSTSDDQAYWARSHAQLDYSDVFSVTGDEVLRGRIAGLIESLRGHRGQLRILVPGCGTRTFLERDLADRFTEARLTASDFGGVIGIPASKFDHPRVSYVARDTRALGFSREFDFAIVINSILSGVDRDNRRMLASIRESLTDGGYLIGLFPTVFCTVDLASCDPELTKLGDNVMLATSRIWEETQGVTQIFYSPLRLNAILAESGFERVLMEIFFCESPILRTEARRIYGIDEHGYSMIYELLIVARAVR